MNPPATASIPKPPQLPLYMERYWEEMIPEMKKGCSHPECRGGLIWEEGEILLFTCMMCEAGKLWHTIAEEEDSMRW